MGVIKSLAVRDVYKCRATNIHFLFPWNVIGKQQNCIGAPMNGRVVEGPMQIDMKEIHSDMSSLLLKIIRLPREISWIEI